MFDEKFENSLEAYIGRWQDESFFIILVYYNTYITIKRILRILLLSFIIFPTVKLNMHKPKL